MSYSTDQEKLGDAMTALKELINRRSLWDESELSSIHTALRVITEAYHDLDEDNADYE